MELITKKVNPDKRGRISLKGLVEGADGYEATRQADGTIILKPYLQVDSREAWLYKNKEAISSLEQGLKDVSEGRVTKRKSYSEYADIEID